MPACAELHLVDGHGIDDAQLAGLVGWLSEGEMARYQRFARPERRRQFLLGRVLARQMLGHLLGVAARTLQIAERPGQAPVLCGHDGAVAFSISHSGPWVACATSAGSALGLDIEVLDAARDIDALAAHAFDAQRCAWLAGRPAHSRLRDFYHLWSAHEARIKLGAEPAMTYALAHPCVSVVLCSAAALSPAPQLIIRNITG